MEKVMRFLIVLLFIVVIFTVTTIGLYAHLALECGDISGCSGASCSGSGTVSSCNISCEDGSSIRCNSGMVI